MPDRRPLGIFGGTFDPVHFGHLRLAEEAIAALGLAGVRWIPAGQPNLRDAPQVRAAQRLAMVRLAVAGNPRFEVDAAEVLAERASYTVTTLERLRQSDACGSERPLVLLLGADAFAQLTDWHRWPQLFELAHVAVALRPGCRVATSTWPAALASAWQQRYRDETEVLTTAPAGHIVSFAMTQLDISATKIRALLSTRESIRYLLPDTLIAYIHDHHLYPEN
ncbi:MAG: nicotinate-nucleotide adenylyltransferase [Propionivibrio sp.]